MVLTLEEKEKLLEKATKLYNELKEIKIRDNIKINVEPKYYNKDSSYIICGYKFYVNGTMSLFNKTINHALEDLKDNIEYKKDNTKPYKGVNEYDTNALLDFIYNGKYILENVKSINEKTRNELTDLLN